MPNRQRLTGRLPLTRLLSVSICLCAFAFAPTPHFAMLAGAKSVDAECPTEQDGEQRPEELVVCSSTRHRTPQRDHRDHPRLDAPQVHFRHGSLRTDHLLRPSGHRLANGLCAPLLI